MESLPETIQILPEKKTHKVSQAQEIDQKCHKQIHEPTKHTNMRKPNKTPSKKFFKFVNIRISGKLS